MFVHGRLRASNWSGSWAGSWRDHSACELAPGGVRGPSQLLERLWGLGFG